MKSPRELADRLKRQWQAPSTRVDRLLGDASAWPISLQIGLPTAREFVDDARAVREHVNTWREVKVGQVVKKEAKYRAAADPVSLPMSWELRTASEWARATGDPDVQREQRRVSELLAARAQSWAHQAIVRYAPAFAELGLEECLQVVDVAAAVEAGCALGKPLRALSVCGSDSKFFERHRFLVSRLIDARFDGAASDLGLEEFLGAMIEHDHWLLIAQLYHGPLHFSQFRVSNSTLLTTSLPGSHVIAVENERCLHQLPKIDGLIAVLGAGRNLSWLGAHWLAARNVAYWGDIDTWGLAMLASARQIRPSITALLMRQEVYDSVQERAVVEPTLYAPQHPDGLTHDERALYSFLANCPRGRLEQEFIPLERVHEAVIRWHRSTS